MFLKKNESKVVWFTGLSGAGKSTLSNYLSDQLKKLNSIHLEEKIRQKKIFQRKK